MPVANLRPVAIFGTVAGLGLLLVHLLARGPSATVPSSRPRVHVVDVPESGAAIPGPASLPGFTLLRAEGIQLAPVRPVTLEDGTKVPFRDAVLTARRGVPLPSPARGVDRMAIEGPVVLFRPAPRTRADLARPATEGATRIEAPRGVLERGPGEGLRLSLEGPVAARADRGGTPWTFDARERAEADLQRRTVVAPGPARIGSPGVAVEGTDLSASESARSLVLEKGARGTVAGGRGARVPGAGGGGEIRFRCTDRFSVAPLPAAADGLSRTRVRLEREAVLEQGDGTLRGDVVEVDLASRPGAGDEGPVVEAIRASGVVTVSGGTGGRAYGAATSRLAARAVADGRTEVVLEGEPRLRTEERALDGSPRGTLDVASRGPATLLLPADRGPVEGRFTGGATAVQTVPPQDGQGAPAVRTLRAPTLLLAGTRRPEGLLVDEVRGEGGAALDDGPRSARARTAVLQQRPDGWRVVRLSGDVTASWPAAGALDPVAPLADGAAGTADPGTMLVASPETVVLEIPPEGDRGSGGRVTAGNGVVLRRVAGEREVYRLLAATVAADLAPGSGALRALDARGGAALEGRGEGEGGRRYALSGERLVLGKDPEGAVAFAGAGRRAAGSFLGEDGRPFRVEGTRIAFERATGRFEVEGPVDAEGLLPDRGPAGPGGRTVGSVRLLAGRAEGVLAEGRGRPDGRTRVVSLLARDAVRLLGATERAEGDRLDYDGEKGEAVLRGAPARVVAAAGPPGRDPAGPWLEDLCEAPALWLSTRDGEIREARAPSGGLLVRHRFPPPAAPGEAAPPPERLEARCRGPLVHHPEETTLGGSVEVLRRVRVGGEVLERERLEGADEVLVLHPSAGGRGGPGPVTRAVATSAAGSIAVASKDSGWSATGVSRVEIDPTGDTVLLESSAGSPRFRVEHDSGTHWYRRAVYDYRRRLFSERVRATVTER